MDEATGYYLIRAVEEAIAAVDAHCPRSRSAHLELARRYADRAGDAPCRGYRTLTGVPRSTNVLQFPGTYRKSA